jgi:hypothetical protein
MRLANDRPSFTPVHSQIRAIGPRNLHLWKGRGPRFIAQVSLYSNTLGVAIAQSTYATDAGGEIAALRQLLKAVELDQRKADFLIAVKHSRRKGFRLIRDRLTYARRFPWRTSDYPGCPTHLRPEIHATARR